MSLVNLRRLRALSIIVFTIGIFIAGMGYSINYARRPQPKVGTGFTLVTKQTFTPAGPHIPLPDVAYVIAVRHQKSDGSWKDVKTWHNADGTVKEQFTSFGLVGRGVFSVNQKNKTLDYLSSFEARKSDAPLYDYRRDPQFLREDLVLGYKTYVVRRPEDDGSGYTETYYAPALDNSPIKEIEVSPRGTAITELTQIMIGEPNEQEFSSLPDWSVNYDLFEKKIESLEDGGNHETAEAMRQELRQHRQQNPDK